MKKIKIISVFIIFILSFISHFIYNYYPNYIFSILFPVNESIWEHMKLLVTPVLFYSIFEYIYLRKNNISFNNFLFSYSISSILGIIIYLIIYIPLYDIFGHNAFIAISLLFIIYILMEIISYYIMNTKKIMYGNMIGILIIVFMYFIFYYFTYYPPRINLFYDMMSKGYGIINK